MAGGGSSQPKVALTKEDVARILSPMTFGGRSGPEPEINKLFKMQIKLESSDMHLQVGKPMILRIRGTLRETDMPPISEEQMWRMFLEVMDERNKYIMAETGGADFSHIVPYEGKNWRFRVNLLRQLGKPGLVARKVEQNIPNFEGLYLPPVMANLCDYEQGMVLLAGVTGSGKSTTIASMLDFINHRKRVHILTIEDPIEFVYTQDKALINQRELGMDTLDFHVAMKGGEFDDASKKLKSMTPLPFFNGNAWQGSTTWPDPTLGWVQITARGGHPGNDLAHAGVRRWTAPRSGKYSVKSKATHEVADGDGIRCRIISSRTGLLAEALVHNRAETLDIDSLTLEAGDTLDFVVDIHGGLNSDQHLWSPVVTEQATPSITWNAERDFAGPAPVLLTEWEQLAQVLLLSNELMFVD